MLLSEDTAADGGPKLVFDHQVSYTETRSASSQCLRIDFGCSLLRFRSAGNIAAMRKAVVCTQLNSNSLAV